MSEKVEGTTPKKCVSGDSLVTALSARVAGVASVAGVRPTRLAALVGLITEVVSMAQPPVDVLSPGVAGTEPLRAVRSAVSELRRALGAAGGGYLSFVNRWLADVEQAGGRLVPFSKGLVKAGQRLPVTPPALREGRDAFHRVIEAQRRCQREAERKSPRKPPSRACSLSSQVCPA